MCGGHCKLAMKVVFIYPRWTSEQTGIMRFFSRKVGVVPPLGLAYLAAITEAEGHEVLIIDAEAEQLDIVTVLQKIEAFSPNIIGITASTTFFNVSVKYARIIKEKFPPIPLCIGGAHITILKKKVFYEPFDYAFIGEAEKSWSLFLRAFNNKHDFDNIPGFMYRHGKEIIVNQKVDIVEDLDTIPFPAWHLLKPERYLLRTASGKIKRVATLFTMRGCPFKCIFCSTEMSGHVLRKRDPKRAVDEMCELIEQYDIKHFMFMDETFTIDRNHVIALCNEIIARNLEITFEAGTRANLIDEVLMQLMVKAGLTRLGFGLESVNAKVRELARKEIPVEAYISANKLANKYNVQTRNSCIIGLPGETKDSIRELLRFIRRNPEMQIINMTIATPYPGTELYDIAKRQLHGVRLVEDDFSKFRRYGSPVLQVGDLMPEDLLRYQNDAYVSVYMSPSRWFPMIRAYGFSGFLLTVIRAMRACKRIVRDKDKIFFDL